MQRLSTKWTWWHKKGWPIFWCSFVGLFVPLSISGVRNGHFPNGVPLIPIGLIVIGVLLWRLLCYPLVDEVWLVDDILIVKNRGDESRYSLADVKSVEGSMLQNPEQVVLKIRIAGDDDKTIRFSPTARRIKLFSWETSQHPLVTELLSRIQELKNTTQRQVNSSS